MAPPFDSFYINKAFLHLGYNEQQQSVLENLFDKSKIDFKRCRSLHQAIDTINQRLQEELHSHSLCINPKHRETTNPECIIVLGGIISRVKERMQYALHLVASGKIQAKKMIILAQELHVGDINNTTIEACAIHEVYKKLTRQPNDSVSAITVDLLTVTTASSQENKRATAKDTIHELIKRSVNTNQCVFVSSSPHGPYHQSVIEGITGHKITLYCAPSCEKKTEIQVIMDIITRCIYAKERALKVQSVGTPNYQKDTASSSPASKPIKKATSVNNTFLFNQRPLRRQGTLAGFQRSDDTRKWETTLRS